VWTQLDDGGPEALFGYLLQRSAPEDIRMGSIPQTSERQFQKMQATDTVTKVWSDWVESGSIGSRNSWPRVLTSKHLHEEFLEHARRYTPRPESHAVFMKRTWEIFGDLVIRQQTTNPRAAAERFGVPGEDLPRSEDFHGEALNSTGGGGRSKCYIVLGSHDGFRDTMGKLL